ncbi:GFA family protein [Sphingomonas sp.]|uniref:GFA family protein n=1 Tax=Sphingomonas sp. TaxID=28214 RepID=UPI0035C87BC4
MSERMTGGCQCGRVRYSVQVDDDTAYLCHCRMCQRATGGVAAALKQVARDAVTWTREPDYHASSPIAERGFCAACGTPLTFRYLDGSTKLDLTVGSFDDPSRLRPTAHFGWESHHAAWLDTTDLPHLRSDEYQPLVDKWEKVRDA